MRLGVAMNKGLITEDSLKASLTKAKGDIFLAACIAGCTGREMDGYIRRSDELRAFMESIKEVKASDGYDQMSESQFANELARLNRIYKLEAVNVIHEIATMEVLPDDKGDLSAAMMDVKLKAAVQLRGPVAESAVNLAQGSILAELNDLYHKNAPKIMSIRAVQIEYQQDQPESV